MTADYCTVEELRDYIGSETSNFSTVAQAACTGASRWIDGICGRVFTDSVTPFAQVFTPESWTCCYVDDFSTLTGLVVEADINFDFTYGTTLTINQDFVVEPRNQMLGGLYSPYTRIEATLLGMLLPHNARGYGNRDTLRVTARYGWPAVPDEVKNAALAKAAQRFKMKDSPDGFVGVDGWGPVRQKTNPEIMEMLGPYLRDPVSVG